MTSLPEGRVLLRACRTVMSVHRLLRWKTPVPMKSGRGSRRGAIPMLRGARSVSLPATGVALLAFRRRTARGQR
jgi:hypothetical protein